MRDAAAAGSKPGERPAKNQADTPARTGEKGQDVEMDIDVGGGGRRTPGTFRL